MKRPIYYFSAGFLHFVAIYGCLWLLGYAIEKSFDSGFQGSDIIITANSISPDQEYIATTYTGMGGGAAGWCDKVVNVRKRDEPFDSKRNFVFSTSCGANIEISWKSDKNILIIYSTDDEGISLYQKMKSDDHAVEISYLAR
jgi:hypothetical protein